MNQLPSKDGVCATLTVERLADMAAIPQRRNIPQVGYQWPVNDPDRIMDYVNTIMYKQLIDVPLRILGILPGWVLSLLALRRRDWTEVWVCHTEDGSPWMHVSAPGTNGLGLPTITGVSWAKQNDSLHLWTWVETPVNDGQLGGTRLLRGRIESPRECHTMNTTVPSGLEPTNGVLLISAHDRDDEPQVQAEIMAARAAYAYAQPGPNKAKIVAVEFRPYAYMVVHSDDPHYAAGDVIRTF